MYIHLWSSSVCPRDLRDYLCQQIVLDPVTFGEDKRLNKFV